MTSQVMDCGGANPSTASDAGEQGVDGKRVADSVVFAPPASGKIRFVKVRDPLLGAKLYKARVLIPLRLEERDC